MDRTDRRTCRLGPTRVIIAKLSRDGYVCQVLTGTRVQSIITTGQKLTRRSYWRSMRRHERPGQDCLTTAHYPPVLDR